MRAVVPTARLRDDRVSRRSPDDIRHSQRARTTQSFSGCPEPAGAVKRNQRTTEDIQRPGKVAYFRDKYVAENLRLARCAVWDGVGRALRPALQNWCRHRCQSVISSMIRSVFASPRLVRFVEMEYGIPLECLPEAVQRVREVTKHLSFPACFRLSSCFRR